MYILLVNKKGNYEIFHLYVGNITQWKVEFKTLKRIWFRNVSEAKYIFKFLFIYRQSHNNKTLIIRKNAEFWFLFNRFVHLINVHC